MGWETLTKDTGWRHLKAEVPRITRFFAREGLMGLQRCFPAQIRDRSGLTAMEGVNADCHKIDIFVQWPDGTINRPQIIAFQDLYSGKILSWRVDHDPNKVMVMAGSGATGGAAMSDTELKAFRPKNEMEKNIWDYISARDKFSYADLEAEFPIPRYTIRILISRMKRNGCIQISQTTGAKVFYTARSVSQKMEDQLQKRSTSEGAMWAAIRILGSYSIADLVCALAGTKHSIAEPVAKKYMQTLMLSGFLTVLRRADPTKWSRGRLSSDQ